MIFSTILNDNDCRNSRGSRFNLFNSWVKPGGDGGPRDLKGGQRWSLSIIIIMLGRDHHPQSPCHQHGSSSTVWAGGGVLDKATTSLWRGSLLVGWQVRLGWWWWWWWWWWWGWWWWWWWWCKNNADGGMMVEWHVRWSVGSPGVKYEDHRSGVDFKNLLLELTFSLFLPI